MSDSNLCLVCGYDGPHEGTCPQCGEASWAASAVVPAPPSTRPATTRANKSLPPPKKDA